MSAIAAFHPEIRTWFEKRFAEPTRVQEEAWPLIAEGRHVLATAPTGSGKTLTAFLWALNRFAIGDWEPGATRVVYVSPLKALNNDIQRNLTEPIGELARDHGLPPLRVQTRSGDTGGSERQRMLRNPPDILITTPESLGLLLTTVKGRQALATTCTVILDEVHSIVDNRRGVQLMTSVERLALLAGDFQRIALSATVNPLEGVAAYIGGYQLDGEPRNVDIIDAAQDKQLEFRVRFPEEARYAADNGKKIWDPLSDSFREVIHGNRSTLLFTNSRRLSEKITLKINEEQPEPLAYAHHGSLARDIRTEVERRLKGGELRAIVSTSSLEMGIDIGDLDEVLLVQSPPSVAATLQRIGRAGHRVGETSVGTLYPTHPMDFLEAAALARAVDERDIEPIQPMTGALDVLAQIIVSMCASDTWPVDELYRVLRASGPYHELARDHFDLVLDMLAGRYAGSRVRELKPRITHDRIAGTVRANKSAVFAFYTSGGTIPDRGYYTLRHADSGAAIGELDEEFVWEATTGQTFTLGTQNWQIHRITHNDVIVRPAKPSTTAPPFWRSETFNRSHYFSDGLAQYMEMSNTLLDQGDVEAFKANLTEQRGFDDVASDMLHTYLAEQRAATSSALPHRHHLLIELVHSGPAGYSGPGIQKQMVFHTFWGGQLNRPWALALEAAWRRTFAARPEIHADDNAVVVQVKEELDPAELLALVQPEELEPLLRQSLENSGYFGARFRECAGRSLLLPKARFNQRLPLWMSRLQAKKLMSATRSYSDFPVMLETWRTCLVDEFDLDALAERLGELRDGVITWTFAQTTTPSPFAANVTFDQVSRYMYADDTPEAAADSALSDDLLRSAVYNEHLRPTITRAVVEEFEAKRQRRAPGYEPNGAEEWGEWLKERILLPADEWPADIETQATFRIRKGGQEWLAHLESALVLEETGMLQGCDYPDDLPQVEDPRSAEQLAGEMLSFYGPRTVEAFAELMPVLPTALFGDSERYVQGPMLDGDDTQYVCDADNFEVLLRFQRAARRTLVEARPLSALPGFLAAWQGFGKTWSDHNAADMLDALGGYPAPVKVWLRDIPEARLSGFADHLLDEAFIHAGLAWLGTGNQQVTLCYPDEVAALRQAGEPSQLAELFSDRAARYGYHQLLDASRQDPAAFSESLWQAVWSGEIASDSLATLRQGLSAGFSLPDAPEGRTSRRSLRARRIIGWQGNWLLNPPAETEVDPLTELENHREQARAMLDRYGLACRELANREGTWRSLFRALRLMELAGEVIAGYFFEGLSGPQFISPRGLNRLNQHDTLPSFWLNACDPAAPCGLGVDWPDLPHRRAGNYLAFHHGELALVVENLGRRLTYHVPAGHDSCDTINAVLVYLARQERRIAVETINGEAARSSPYLVDLERVLLATSDHRNLYFEPR